MIKKTSNILNSDFEVAEGTALLLILETAKQEAQSNGQADKANHLWFLSSAVKAYIKHIEIFNKLKSHQHYDAWCQLEQLEISLKTIKRHYPARMDGSGLTYILKVTQQFQDLFPYRIFLSPGLIATTKRCSICHQEVNFYSDCDHIKGMLYNGEICFHSIEQAIIEEVSLVTTPMQKACVAFVEGRDYEYPLLEYLFQCLDTPFRDWEFTKTNKLHPKELFGKIKRNEPCPCESGKKYKKCCSSKEGVERPHYQFHFIGFVPNRSLDYEYVGYG